MTPLTKRIISNELTKGILPFWMNHMVDRQNGGFFGRIDGNNQAHPTANKSVILNTRILWTFSVAYQYQSVSKYRFMADRAYDYISKYFMDDVEGGVFWMLDHQGNVIDNKKQIYAQAFAIYALSEYFKINPNRRAKEYSTQLFELIEEHAFDRQRNGYIEALDSKWSTLKDVRLSEKDLNAEKTMNTHLHVLEAYTNLYRIWKSDNLKHQLSNLVRLILEKFVSQDFHFKLFFNMNWVLKNKVFSFGHDIEGSWLLCEAAEELRDPSVTKAVKETAIRMVDSALKGMDDDGALMNEGGPDGLRDTNKDWWPQAEALVGLVNAWQLSGEYKYMRIAERVWDFISNNLKDPKGEWHWGTTRDGQLLTDEDKAGPWKCPYHNSRAMFELIRRLNN